MSLCGDKYQNMEQKFQELINQVKTYNNNPQSLALITKAYEFARLSHTGQKRASGEAYVCHPLEVGILLAHWKLDVNSISSGILHDTIEDGGATNEDLVSEFGEEIAFLVNGVTKVSHLRIGKKTEEEFVENLRKMFLAMAKDLRVVFVKLADRLHNMRTLAALPSEKHKRIAQETLDIFAPLAERLGMGEVKGELEDLAFPYAYPEEYKKVVMLSKPYYKRVEEHIEEIRKTLLKKIVKEKVTAKIYGRKKHLYSLWKKLERPGIEHNFSKVYDIVALRVLVPEIKDCYLVLGIIHDTYNPASHLGFSDFIAQPKTNGYQSIHTKIFGPGGGIVEIQIRTFAMHDQAEHGVAAHWAYSELKSSSKKTDSELSKEGAKVDTKLHWVKQLAQWQEEISDSKEFLHAVKFDALKDRIYVFTPLGDVYDLPNGATPVDFAYAVHTGFGNYIRGATANGKIVPLSKKLKSGDIVEILKHKNQVKPNEDWLSFVATTTARRQIQKHLRKTS